jgi:hypothetical protein
MSRLGHLIAACTRESKCTASRIHQHIEKNSVPLKEVLTAQCRLMQRASRDDIATRFDLKRRARENPASSVVKRTENPFGESVFDTLDITARHACRGLATHRVARKPRCADSESRFLAIKKFSCFAPRLRIGSRQKQFFERIANTDSLAAVRARCVITRHNTTRRSARGIARRSDAELALK